MELRRSRSRRDVGGKELTTVRKTATAFILSRDVSTWLSASKMSTSVTVACLNLTANSQCRVRRRLSVAHRQVAVHSHVSGLSAAIADIEQKA